MYIDRTNQGAVTTAQETVPSAALERGTLSQSVIAKTLEWITAGLIQTAADSENDLIGQDWCDRSH